MLPMIRCMPIRKAVYSMAITAITVFPLYVFCNDMLLVDRIRQQWLQVKIIVRVASAPHEWSRDK